MTCRNPHACYPNPPVAQNVLLHPEYILTTLEFVKRYMHFGVACLFEFRVEEA